MLRFTDRVPYLGLVNWSPDEIHAYATELVAAHTPKRKWFNGRRRCSACSTEWPCYAAQWALGTVRTPPD